MGSPGCPHGTGSCDPTAEPPERGAGFGGLHPAPCGAPRGPGEGSLGRPGTPLHTQSRPLGGSLSLCFGPGNNSLSPSPAAWMGLSSGFCGPSVTGVGPFTGGLVPHCGGLLVLAESGCAALGHCPDGSGIDRKSDLSRSRGVARWDPSQPDLLGHDGEPWAGGTPVLGVCQVPEVPDLASPGFVGVWCSCCPDPAAGALWNHGMS